MSRGDYDLKIEGGELLCPYIMWAPKIPKIGNLHKARIQASAKACILKNSHPSFIKLWLISSEINTTTLYDGTRKLYEKCISKIEGIDQITTSCS